MLDEAFIAWPFSKANGEAIASTWMPACDVIEDSESIKIVAKVPGVKPEDVKISLENNVLTIPGEKKQEAEESSEKVRRYERTYGLFERAFALPGTVDADRIQAQYQNGVLTVTLPKVERARQREILVKAS